jgi:hypothetical protein
MRSLIVALALVFAVPAYGQGLTKLAPGQKSKATSAPLITADANVVSHAWWPTTALVDRKGLTWTQNGTVPVQSTALFTSARSSSGAYSIANYYSRASEAVLNFAGDFTMCFVFVFTAGGNGTLMDLSNSVVSGYQVDVVNASGVARFTNMQSFNVVQTVATVTAGAASVLCVGVSGTSRYIKLNNTATVSAVNSLTQAVNRTFLLGTQAGAAPWLGKIIEVYATTSAWNEATVAALQAAVLAKVK